MVEKLKQRQERVGSGSKVDDHADPVQSLWPTLEDIKYLEVGDQLPVSAFGAPVPRFNPRYSFVYLIFVFSLNYLRQHLCVVVNL